METIDTPVPTSFKNGKVFPPNAVIIGYVLLGISVLAMGVPILGLIGIIVASFIAFTNHGVIIDLKKHQMIEYTNYLGFIRVNKACSYHKYSFVTAIPKRVSNAMYANTSQSYVSSENHFALCLLHGNYRSKKEITLYDDRATAEDVASQLAPLLSLEYFEYDPKVIRKMLRR